MADTIKAFEQFFNDIIAQVIPGSIVLVLVLLILEYELPDSTFAIFVFVGVSYLAGQVVLAIEESFRALVSNLRELIEKCFRAFAIGFREKSFRALVRGLKEKSKEKARQLTAQKSFLTLIKGEDLGIDVSQLSLNDQRSIAMSLSKEAADLGRRFRFISLSCKSSEILLIFLLPIFVQLELFKIETDFNIDISFIEHSLVLLFATIFIIYPLERRVQSFQRRAENVPFSAATAYLLTRGNLNES